MRLKTNLFDACLDMLENKNNISKLDFDAGTALTVVLAAKGYPGKFLKNIKILLMRIIKTIAVQTSRFFMLGLILKMMRYFQMEVEFLMFPPYLKI